MIRRHDTVLFCKPVADQRRNAGHLLRLIEDGRHLDALSMFYEEMVDPAHREQVAWEGGDSARLREVALYYGAWAMLEVEQNESAMRLIGELPVPTSADIDLQPYELFRRQADELAESIALQAAKPGILLIGMPKSASTYLSSLVSGLADIPIGRATFGQYPLLAPVPGWLETVSRGGCTTHDHLPPSATNVQMMAGAGIAHAFIQYRDPRASAWSAYLQHPELADLKRYDLHVEWFTAWLQGWLDLADRCDGPRLHFIDYEEVRLRPAEVLARVLAIAGYDIPMYRIRDLVAEAAANLHLYNFRRGRPDDWRRLLPAARIASSTAVLTPQVRDLMERSGAA